MIQSFDAVLVVATTRPMSNSSTSNKSQGRISISQISYSLVVILELSGFLEVQYKEIMMSSINKDN